MSSSFKTIIVVSLLFVGGCVPVWRKWMREEPSPAALRTGPVQESWCYRTLGSIECYPTPQSLPPESLVSVDPPSRMPASRQAHAKALADSLEVKK